MDKAKYIKWKESLENVLSDKEGFTVFREFLVTQHCEENIDFWKAIEDFKNNTDEHSSTMLATAIFKTFIMMGAVRGVNLNSVNRNKISEIFKSGIQKDMFDDVQQEIFDVMRRDPFQRFLRSDVYKALLN